MKITPMLFKDEMVRAILDGRKTQTRRIVKPAKCRNTPLCNLAPCEIAGEINRGDYSNCPYGEPGDLIYVRENGWERPSRTPKMMREGADTWPRYEYDADGCDHDQNKEWGWKRRPSIHMPRRASRLTLKIKSIRIERLQDISKDDAKAEGVEIARYAADRTPLYKHYQYSNIPDSNPIVSFESLWESINGPASWNANPRVFVIEYEPIMQNVDVYLNELENAA